MVYWITGRAGSGKTTLAKKIVSELTDAGETVVILDGDEVRKVFPTGYSDEDRYTHIMRVARFAKILEDQNITVIIALISPRKCWRNDARKLFNKSKLIYLPGGMLWMNTTYEEPDGEELT